MSIVQGYDGGQPKGPKIKRTTPQDPVADMMEAKGISGKSKEHIILFHNGEMMDHRGRIFEARGEDGEPIEPDLGKGVNVVVLHRRHLHTQIGPHASKQFWSGGRSRDPKPIGKVNREGQLIKNEDGQEDKGMADQHATPSGVRGSGPRDRDKADAPEDQGDQTDHHPDPEG